MTIDDAEQNGHHLIAIGGERYKCTSCDLKGGLVAIFDETCNPRRESRKTRFHAWLGELDRKTKQKQKGAGEDGADE